MKDSDFVHLLAVLYHVKCSQCNRVIKVWGNSDRDVFAPIQCGKCKCFDLFKVSHSMVEEEDNVQVFDSDGYQRCCIIQ